MALGTRFFAGFLCFINGADSIVGEYESNDYHDIPGDRLVWCGSIDKRLRLDNK
jgi:hypothetical protein